MLNRFSSPSHCFLKWEKVITVLQCLILLAFVLFVFPSKLLFWLSEPSLCSLREVSAPVIYLCFAFIAQKSTDFFKVHLQSDSDFSSLSATLITHPSLAGSCVVSVPSSKFSAAGVITLSFMLCHLFRPPPHLWNIKIYFIFNSNSFFSLY